MSAAGHSLYRILGCEQSASANELKTGYRQAAKACHPDLEGGCEDTFKRVSHAWEVLRDPRSRALYDSTLDSPWSGGSSQSSADDAWTRWARSAETVEAAARRAAARRRDESELIAYWAAEKASAAEHKRRFRVVTAEVSLANDTRRAATLARFAFTRPGWLATDVAVLAALVATLASSVFALRGSRSAGAQSLLAAGADAGAAAPVSQPVSSSAGGVL